MSHNEVGIRSNSPHSSFANQSMLRQYRSIAAERILVRQAHRLALDAQQAGVNQRTLQIQAMLHLPAPYVPSWRHPKAAYEAVRPAVLARASAIEQARKEIQLKADGFRIRPNMKIRSNAIHAEDDRRVPLSVRSIAPSMGQHFQSRVHYLLSPRSDTYFDVGLFQEGSTWPVLYLGFSICDRPDLLAAIQYTGRTPIVLTRTVGITDLPANAFSYTLRRALILLGDTGFTPDLLITAINPFVGFNGSSLFASGLKPLASRTVRYLYDTRGQFITARLSPIGTVKCRRRMPPNLIVGRLLDRKKNTGVQYKDSRMKDKDERIDRKVPLATRVHNQPGDMSLPNDLLLWLTRTRAILETGWSERTLHPDFVGLGRSNPARGQCGVSSVWIMRQLRVQFNLTSLYCYGDLTFVDPSVSSIRRHCWLEIPLSKRQRNSIIIDVTVDQAEGFGERVLIEKRSELQKRGIIYKARITKKLEELPLDSVWNRYLVLADSVDTYRAAA